MQRSVRVIGFAGVTLLAVFGAGGAVSAQEDSTTTTQLDLDGGEESTTTAPESTTTTQLDLQQQDGASTTTTQLQVAGDAVTGGVAPPNRIDAGAGGAAGDAGPPMATVLLAAGLVAVTGAAAVRTRRIARG